MNFNISDVSTTKMTSKGQVVIPEEIREYMGLESGVKFLVMATDDSIIFKKIHPIPKQDFKALLEASHRFAEEHGVTEADIEQAIIESRKARKLNTMNKSPTRSKTKKSVMKKVSSMKSKPKGKSST